MHSTITYDAVQALRRSYKSAISAPLSLSRKNQVNNLLGSFLVCKVKICLCNNHVPDHTIHAKVCQCKTLLTILDSINISLFQIFEKISSQPLETFKIGVESGTHLIIHENSRSMFLINGLVSVTVSTGITIIDHWPVAVNHNSFRIVHYGWRIVHWTLHHDWGSIYRVWIYSHMPIVTPIATPI